MSKRYIVTMADEITSDQALDTISEDRTLVKDAVVALETDEYEEASDVLFIEELGISIKTMSDDAASDLRKKDGVLAVEEDEEVFILDDQDESEEGVDDSLVSASNFELGYNQALTDMDMILDELARFDKREQELGRCAQRMPIRTLRQLKRPSKQSVDRLRSSLKQPIPWNISMVQADKVWARSTGRDIKVAILDTGIDEDHSDLIVHGGVSFVPGESSWDDHHSHGTHCAGIVAARNDKSGVVGVAPDAELNAVKVLSRSGSGSQSWVIAGMAWCARNGIRVASLSLGSNVPKSDAPYSVAYQKAAQRLENAGCVVIAAAGNAGKRSNHWVGSPARCPGFMAVASVDRNGQKASTSSWGPPTLGPLEGVEISAPGVRILSTVPGSSHGRKSGTSMACPHVSGAAALVAQMRPTWKPAEIRARLKVTATDIGVPGNDPELGAGLLNCLAAIA